MINLSDIILVPVSKAVKDWPVPLLLAGLVYGEARGESGPAKIGGALVVLNRAERMVALVSLL